MIFGGGRVGSGHVVQVPRFVDPAYINHAALDGDLVQAAWTGIPRMTQTGAKYSGISGLPARQPRGEDGHHRIGHPERWSGANLAIFAGIWTHSSRRLLVNE
jgi:hypothetical protein